MAESVLSRLVKTDKDTKKRLDSMDSTLQKMYALQLKTAKEERAARRRAEQKAKRSGGDVVRGMTGDKKKDSKEEKGKSVLEKILGMLGGLGSGLVKTIGGLGTALAPLLKALATAATIKGLAALVNLLSALSRIPGIKTLGKLLGKGLGALGSGLKSLMGLFVGPKSITAKIGSALGKFKIGKLFGGLFGKNGLGALFGKKGLGALFGKKGLGGLLGKVGIKGAIKGGGILAALTSGIMEYFETGKLTEALFSGGGAGGGAIVGGILGSFLGPVGTAVGAALGAFIGEQLGDILKQQLDKFPLGKKIFDFIDNEFQWFIKSIKNLWKEIRETGAALMKFMNALSGAVQRLWKKHIVPVGDAIGKFLKGTWEKLVSAFDRTGEWFTVTFGPALKAIGKFLKPITDKLKILAQKVIDPLVKGFQGLVKLIKPLLDLLKPLLNPGAAVNNAIAGGLDWFQGVLNRGTESLDQVGRQTGGPVTVPGSGSGDKVPMMLPSGSFVMNRNAARFQTGGMVPTLLEPGEHVYGPGQWGAHHAMMNSAIPRFQSGGLVETSHPDTGSGYQPSGATDYKGRPVVFNKGGAEAFAKAMAASGGAVKGGDVASSKRSRAKNASLPGAHPNSTHLYGEGLDASGSTAAWLKENPNYGWKYGYSHGPGSIHFNYKGPGAGGDLPPDDNYDTPKNAVQNIMSSTMDALGDFSGLVKGMVGAIGEVFGPELNAIFGNLGGLLGGGGGGGAGGGGGVSAGGAGGGATSVNDPNAKALLNAIADAEGTSQYPNNGYKTFFGGSQWTGEGYPKDHPRIDKGGSDAFGRYQFMSPTWAEYANGRDMSPAGQDSVAMDLVTKKRGVNITDGLSAAEVKNLSYEWASIKGAGYTFNGRQQGKYGTNEFLGMYEGYGGKIQGRQSGGSVNLSSTASSSSFARQSEDQFIQRMANAMGGPVIVTAGGGGGGNTRVAPNPGTQTAPPTLNANPSNNAALDLAYRLSMGASFA